MNRDRVARQIKEHEAFRSLPYNDRTGANVKLEGEARLTIGWGRNLQDVGISDAEANFLFQTDLDRAVALAKKFAARYSSDLWACLNDERQEVLVNMAFQLGFRLYGFRRFGAAMRMHDYNTAADEMMDSKWARDDSPRRAYELSSIMRSGRSL